jgi:hypothetical protein
MAQGTNVISGSQNTWKILWGPTGVRGVNAITIGKPLGFSAAEARIEPSNVSMYSYGVLASPSKREYLNTTAAFVGAGLST